MPLTTGERAGIPTRALTPLALARLVADWSRREASRHAESIEAAQESGAQVSMSDARTTDQRRAHRGRRPGTRSGAPAVRRSSRVRHADHALGVGTIGGVWEALYCVIRDITTEDAAGELATTHAPCARRLRVVRSGFGRTSRRPPTSGARSTGSRIRLRARARCRSARSARGRTQGARRYARPMSTTHALCAPAWCYRRASPPPPTPSA
jgi:hypothetical protein